MNQSSIWDYSEKTKPHQRSEIHIDTVGTGYTTVSPCNSPQKVCYVHRLAAVAEFGMDAVANSSVHHSDGCKWNNSRDNLELLSRTEHAREHDLGGHTTPENDVPEW